MKYLFALTLTLVLGVTSFAQLKPYTLASEVNENIQTVELDVRKALEAAGFEIVGSYSPSTPVTRQVLVISHPDLLQTVAKLGGLNGFMSVLRVGITYEDGISTVSYTTPEYWANAYLRENYDGAEVTIQTVATALQTALASGPVTQFGSESGLEPEKLRKYKYMMGMPRFEDTDLLHTYTSHSQALNTIESNLLSTVDSLELVYSVQVPGSDLLLYGIAMAGPEGEGSFMPTIDIANPRHTAFLPYEFLVKGNEVHMLHGRYRIALSFPDLKMGTFMKIVSTPKDIKRRLGELASPQVDQ